LAESLRGIDDEEGSAWPPANPCTGRSADRAGVVDIQPLPFVWAMEARHAQASTMDFTKPADQAALLSAPGLGDDFLAVFDVGPGASFGKLVTTLPVGPAMQAHHTKLCRTAGRCPVCQRLARQSHLRL
jgi:hypothetical protein